MNLKNYIYIYAYQDLYIWVWNICSAKHWGSSLRKDGGLSTENKIQTQSASKGHKYNSLCSSSNSSHGNNNNDNKNDIMLPLDYNFIQMIKITSNMTCSYTDDFYGILGQNAKLQSKFK